MWPARPGAEACPGTTSGRPHASRSGVRAAIDPRRLIGITAQKIEPTVRLADHGGVTAAKWPSFRMTEDSDRGPR